MSKVAIKDERVPERVNYKAGDIVCKGTIQDDNMSLYIIASVGGDSYMLINMQTGCRYDDSCRMGNLSEMLRKHSFRYVKNIEITLFEEEE